MNTPPLAIVVKGWPRLSETFIAQELVALEQSGIAFDVWSLRHPTDVKTHPLHDRLQARVRYLPEYLHQEPRRVHEAMGAVTALAGFDAAADAYARDLARDDTANRRRRWGQACVLAHEADGNLEALYAHFLHTPSSVARYAAMLRGVPWSFSAHAKDIWTSPEWELREKLSADTYGAAFGATCTRFGAEHLQALADTPERVDLVYHGLDLARFPDPPARTPRRADDPLHMMSVGRLVEKKGFDTLIDALALLPTDLAWSWTHIGGGTLDAQLRERAQEAGVADRITWRGACDQPDVIVAMRQADLFVLPSRIAADGDRDGLPNVLMEAASQMLPILSTPVSAIPEFITHNTHGLLVRDTPQAFADAMQQVARDPALGPRLARAAHTRLHAEFTMAPGIAHLAKRLRGILKGS
ncbi:glycosyltransferase family 4 protein [Sulfitobacter sp. F26169L]|uniref:glycosyltransferase family 4 protein n=1 Tax=Sulfitobacter sp. F26169L TaxID=2996015 RepID=UPI0022608972|nr:glycosyltransferase family 4 protein [Sulfitobacter sp. F26169L]MCX7567296.1 glycosyltransferase family 4 protein [Sulfitobacter sp. F26169L]